MQASINIAANFRNTKQYGTGVVDECVWCGLEAGGLNLPNTPDVPPEELYATQLSQLQEMGFFDTQENIRALRATSRNVHAAVERLLGNPST
ncbi:ubiquitin domain-containing protein DSK2a-like [Camellia sinensis]|uniref:ubiquitin domain-containing protein DSK2a-like n=1 Tax=Camellia sinensis TaxID=4442 RepID=UPI001035F9CC|nr:ubiquitin domain-containing protein DSK2a-like [Camellia sinensis]